MASDALVEQDVAPAAEQVCSLAVEKVCLLAAELDVAPAVAAEQQGVAQGSTDWGVVQSAASGDQTAGPVVRAYCRAGPLP